MGTLEMDVGKGGGKMLTATYALVAMSVEQTSIRSSLAALKKSIKNYLGGRQEGDEVRVQFLLKKIARLHQRCQWRKVDMYLIPAIRRVTRKADQLLAELESLSLLGLSMLRSIRNRLAQAVTQRSVKWEDLSGAIELYCNTLLKKLEKEELELFSVARKEISHEEWFSIAEKFLMHDEKERERLREPHVLTLAQITAHSAVQMPAIQSRMINHTNVTPIFLPDAKTGETVLSYFGTRETTRILCARM
jgi:hemerythrin-like domain-containing protein